MRIWGILLILFLICGDAEATSPKIFNKIELNFSETPEFNKPVGVIFDIEYYPDYYSPNATIQIDLDDGVEHVSGDLIWEGKLTTEPIQLKAIVKPIKKDEWIIVKGRVIFGPDSMKTYRLFVFITDEFTEVTDSPPMEGRTLLRPESPNKDEINVNNTTLSIEQTPTNPPLQIEDEKGVCGPTSVILLTLFPAFGIKRWKEK